MATTLEFVEYIHEQSGLGSQLSYRKMFGEYALYLDGKVIALACDNSLYIKITSATEQYLNSFATKPPYPGAKPHIVGDELQDDADELRKILLATAASLPKPKPKQKPVKPTGQKKNPKRQLT